MPQPQPKTNTLIEQLNSLLEQEEPNLFVLNTIKTEAEKLKKTDSLMASVVLGMVACIQRDIPVMRYNHLNALRLSPSNPLANFNFAQSLHNTGFFSEAIKLYTAAHNLDRENLFFLERAAKNMFFAGRLRQTKQLLEEWSKLKPGEVHPRKILVERIHRLLDESEISDDIVESLQDTAMSLLRDKGIYRSSVALDLIRDEGELFAYDVSVAESPKTIAAFNLELANRIAEKFDDPHADRVVISYTPYRSAHIDERKSA